MNNDERISIRVKKEIKQIIQYATDLLGISLQEFLINSSVNKAQEFISQHEKILGILNENSYLRRRETMDS